MATSCANSGDDSMPSAMGRQSGQSTNASYHVSYLDQGAKHRGLGSRTPAPHLRDLTEQSTPSELLMGRREAIRDNQSMRTWPL